MSKFQIIFSTHAVSEFKVKIFDNFNANFVVGNLQLPDGKSQLSAIPQLF